VLFVIGTPDARGSGIEGSRVRLTVDALRKRRYGYHATRR
jgi:hypothetical protein